MTGVTDAANVQVSPAPPRLPDTVSTVNTGPEESAPSTLSAAGAPQPAKVLVSLVSYGMEGSEDSDSDADV